MRDFVDNVYLVMYQVLQSVNKLGDYDDIEEEVKQEWELKEITEQEKVLLKLVLT